jgi:predicted PurR-regulated permease PerM
MKEQINQARWIGVLAATGIALYLCWLMLRPFITVLEWATVLVIVFYPVHKRLAKKIKRRGLSALLSSLLVIVILVLPLIFLTMALTNELAGAARNLPAHVAQLLDPETPVTGKVSKWIHDHVAVDTARSQEFVVEQLKTAGTVLLGQSLGLVGNILSGIVKAFFVIITMYYLFRDGDKIVRALPGALPLSNHQSEAILARISQVVSASVYGVVTIAMLQGMLGGLAFWVLGVPSPILWAVVLVFVCMIPIAGSFFVWLPASIYLMTTGHWTKAILLLLWGALVISTIDNFLRPKLIKNQTKLHELFVFFSVLGGMSVFGLLGIVLGPVVLAITLGLLDTFKLDKLEAEKEQAPDKEPRHPVDAHPIRFSKSSAPPG